MLRRMRKVNIIWLELIAVQSHFGNKKKNNRLKLRAGRQHPVKVVPKKTVYFLSLTVKSMNKYSKYYVF